MKKTNTKLNMEMNEVKAIRKSLIRISRAYGDIVDWCKSAIRPESKLTEDWEYEMGEYDMSADNPICYFIKDVVDEEDGCWRMYADDMRTINGWLQDAADRAAALKQEADEAVERIDDGKVDDDDMERFECWADDNEEVLYDDNSDWLDDFLHE